MVSRHLPELIFRVFSYHLQIHRRRYLILDCTSSTFTLPDSAETRSEVSVNIRERPAKIYDAGEIANKMAASGIFPRREGPTATVVRSYMHDLGSSVLFLPGKGVHVSCTVHWHYIEALLFCPVLLIGIPSYACSRTSFALAISRNAWSPSNMEM